MTSAQVIDGQALADDITSMLKKVISGLDKNIRPGLATILVGDDPASAIYVRNKLKKAKEIGINTHNYNLDRDTSEKELLMLIKQLNDDENIQSILVQLPLPKQIDEKNILEAVDPKKDVDGFHPTNLGYLLSGQEKITACTPQGIMHIIDSVGYDLTGKHAVILGRSNIVGKPLFHLLLKRDATVTICHSKTRDLEKITKEADLLVAAIGKPKFINSSHIKKGVFIIDVGISKDQNNKICGDVDFNDVKDLASFITPVPKGVGPLTIAMLLKNALTNFQEIV